MKSIAIDNTPILGGLFCLGYRPELLQKNAEGRVEFVFKHSKELEKDIEDIKKGTKKFEAQELSLELHSVRSRIKTFTKNFG